MISVKLYLRYVFARVSSVPKSGYWSFVERMCGLRIAARKMIRELLAGPRCRYSQNCRCRDQKKDVFMTMSARAIYVAAGASLMRKQI